MCFRGMCAGVCVWKGTWVFSSLAISASMSSTLLNFMPDLALLLDSMAESTYHMRTVNM